jgi:hypothetical protein
MNWIHMAQPNHHSVCGYHPFQPFVRFLKNLVWTSCHLGPFQSHRLLSYRNQTNLW